MTIKKPVVVEILPTQIWIENGICGDRSVVLQHQGMKPFVYARFGYDYAYTSNAGTWDAAQQMARSLGATDPIEVRSGAFPKMPTADELRAEIKTLTELLQTIEKDESATKSIGAASVVCDDVEHQATLRSEFPNQGVIVSLTISRDEPDSADEDRYAVCSGVLIVEETGTGKHLESVQYPEQWEIHSSVYGFMVDAAREGDFDEIVEGSANSVKTRQAPLDKREKNPASSMEEKNPALRWFTIEQAKPPEQKNVVAMLDSGIPILGRNIFGRFAEYDSANDRFVEWMEGHADGFHGIKCWAEVVDPGQPENELNSRILLAEALRYIDSPEKVDVDWLAASIQRHQNGLTLCARPKGDAVSIAPVAQSVPGAVLAFPGMPEAEINELVEALKKGGNTLFRLADDIAAPVLRDVAASAGLDADEFQP